MGWLKRLSARLVRRRRGARVRLCNLLLYREKPPYSAPKQQEPCSLCQYQEEENRHGRQTTHGREICDRIDRSGQKRRRTQVEQTRRRNFRMLPPTEARRRFPGSYLLQPFPIARVLMTPALIVGIGPEAGRQSWRLFAVRGNSWPCLSDEAEDQSLV